MQGVVKREDATREEGRASEGEVGAARVSRKHKESQPASQPGRQPLRSLTFAAATRKESLKRSSCADMLIPSMVGEGRKEYHRPEGRKEYITTDPPP